MVILVTCFCNLSAGCKNLKKLQLVRVIVDEVDLCIFVYACEQLVFLRITDTICKLFSINLQQQKYRLHSSSCRIIALVGYIVVNALVGNIIISPKVAVHYDSKSGNSLCFKNGKLHYASSNGKLIDVEKFGNFYYIFNQLHCKLRDAFGRRTQNFTVASATFSPS